jgi:alpha-2-macroglobulin
MTRDQKIAAIVGAVGLIAIGFGGGYLTARGGPGAALGGSGYASARGGGGSIGKEPAGFNWFGFGKPRAANARRAEARKPDGFAVWTNRIDTSGAQPQACIRMTRKLDAGKSYADYVMVSPELGAAPAVRVKGDEICVAGVGFVDRRVTLLKGLPAAGGETLAENADVDFTFGDKPPYVGFAGDGVILPREDGDGVGIETVNVSRLNIEVWRVPDRNLVRRKIAAVDPAGEGDYIDDWESKPDEEGRVVWKGQIAVKGDPGQRATTVFPLGAVLKDLKPGGYVIKAADASGRAAPDGKDADEDDESEGQPARAQRWIIFTDMALLSYSGEDGMDAVVRSLKTARPMANIRVALVAKNGEDLADATTDAAGRVRFPGPLMKGEGAAEPKMLLAYGPQADMAMLDLERSPVDLSKQGVAGRQTDESMTGGRSAKTSVDGYLYADRGIYRPGETVHLVALVRDLQARAIKDRKGALVIKRPSGVEFQKIVFDKAADGVVARDIVLPKAAPRGRWSAQLQMEGLDDPSGSLSISVEDFAPQRLEVKANGAENRPVTGGESRKIEVLARFLYGATGSGLQTQGEVRLRADPNPFPQFKDFQWGDQQTPFEEKFVELGQTVTDGDGRATLMLASTEAGEAKQPLVAALTASVFEPGGRPVREGMSLKVRTAPLYLGVKVDQPDTMRGNVAPVAFDIVAVDAFGRRASAPGTTWTLLSENWNYDWFQQDGKWQWRRTSRDAVVDRGVVNVGAGAAVKLAKRLGWGDYRLVLEGPEGARTVVRFSAGWGAPAKDAEAPDMVRVSAGTRTYGQGDTVEVTIKPPYAGQVQVAVATDRVIDMKTMDVGPDGATIQLKTSAEWGGGAYVMVTVIQPRDPVSTPRPRRALGLVYVPLDPGKRKLTVDIGTPDKLDAKAQVAIPIAVKGLGVGQRAHVTVAAVDEGILQLTKQASPDPAKWYFGKRALGVDYRDDYGRLLDPNLGAPANINFGGDEIGGEGLTVTPIKTVALWSGVVETGADGKAVVKLPAALFNGQLRIMAVAWTDDAVGSGSKAMTVREPVIAELALPRFLAPGDKAFATLELHNVEGRPGAYTAVVNGANGLISTFRKVFNLLLGQRIAERVPLDAPNVAGIGKVGLQVTGPGFTSATDYPIQTRLGWGPLTRTTTELQRPGEAYTPPASLLAGLAAGTVSLDVSYSPFRGFDPAPIAAALSRYPYGCTEQLVSTAYPLLYAQELSADPKLRRVSATLNETVGKLLDRQTLDGAFGLWRVGDGEADAWLGAYTTDFLIEAQRRGAAVPQSAIDRALNAMKAISKPEGWVSISYRTEYPKWWAADEEASKKATERMRSRASAYALYVMAKGGRGDLPRLRWYHDVQFKTEASPLARAQVAAGLAMMGDKARAHDSFLQAIGALGYKDPTDWYQSPLRDLSGLIALAYEAGEPAIARSLQGRLENSVRDPDSLNTQEQARLLQAAHHMLAAAGRIRIDAKGATALPALGGPRWSVGRLADARFANQGSGALWRTVTVRGVPTASPAADGQGLSVSKRYLTFAGAAADPGALTQGERVIVLIAGDSAQARSLPLVIDDALPAGFEVEMTLGPDDAKDGPFKFLGELSTADVQEARDDRYVAAMDVEGGKPFRVAYVARAVTPGDFYLPGAMARDMYRPSVFSRSAGSRAKIAPAG